MNLHLRGTVMIPNWNFEAARERSRNVDPAEDLFFESLPPLGAVIRESTQNSLDASDDGSKVKMRIAVNTGNNAMPADLAKKYFTGLFSHLRASEIQTPNVNAPMNYVVVEDFGTKGLEGDAAYNGLGDDAPDNRFYWFHRNTNRTNSNATKRGGSYGYGKHAFANASEIKSFFSVSRDKNGVKIFGNSVGKMHRLGEKIYHPYGDFGDVVVNDNGEVLRIMPSDSEEFFKKISNDFNLSRTNELGLSVIIPYPKRVYRDEEIIESMIRAYFMPICQGKLEIIVDGSHETVINSDTIYKICDTRTWAGKPAGAMTTTNRKCMNGLIELANWWSSGNANEFSLDPPSNKNIVWNRDLIPEDSYDTIRSRLDSGKPVALRIEIPIFKYLENKKLPREPRFSKITILIKKDESYGRSDAIWIRRYLSVPKPVHMPVKNGFVAIMISEDGPLEELLRSSEEVAHTEHRVKRIESDYKYGGDAIRFFRQAATRLIDYLQVKKELFEKDWIDDWFPSEEIENTSKPKKRKRKKKQNNPNEDEVNDEDDTIIGPPPPPEDLSKNHSWELDKIPGGFSIHGDINLQVDYLFTVRMAYARDDGKDPIKKWKPFDFDVKNLTIEESGIIVEKSEGNTIVFRAIGPAEEYSIDVTGFDVDRDLATDPNGFGL